ncbi:uncharacterized protein LACBIDRAFT_292246 [Laccaria bicolor S238N-H82]|uniref:Predicted protein n=1 Tax=Laccaria bicolor (strain S238N-H82 / ATCC MYA-4686) TaxID=486041 RepID=B0CSC0_LACBS|nr:uncharacterized protein LACBIDRAFT_292246 [Laccaria bicolor S238N-H82]EDR14279.1 predicted protein [Laccaria bicolor S238N-H82]|eukprot:XP_001874838.1 predicted protein [Laccaria bicolor S238N-H82]
MKNPDSAHDSLTPQRKHRKLLKDGSGTEVWPESIEKIFVQGLKEYWNSPYATYSQSRGRSRWRNQFLVEYLQSKEITRSKKQVASHIQVLRNMWKGEPEYYLVAGADETPADSASSGPVKLEDQWDETSLIPFDDDNDDSSSHSVSPNYSPPDSQSDFPLTPKHHPHLAPTEISPLKSQCSPTPLYPSLSTSPTSPVPSISPFGAFPNSLYPDHSPHYNAASLYSQSSGDSAVHSTAHLTMPSSLNSSRSTSNRLSIAQQPRLSSRNRVTSFFLTADGMTPFSVNVDSLMALSGDPGAPRFTLRVKLLVPTMNDLRSPSTLHGFAGSICLANVWSVSGRCTTKVFAGSSCISEETGFLDVSHIAVGTVNAVLPESSLTRCRWLDPNTPLTMTQEVTVDDEILLHVIYDLDRRSGGPMPSAELIGFQKCRLADKAPFLQTSAPYLAVPTNTPSARRGDSTSLSFALTPLR